VGHTRDLPAGKVVTTAAVSVEPTPSPVKPAVPPTAAQRPLVDFAFVREQVKISQVLQHLGLVDRMHCRGPQLRGPCPIHGQPTDSSRTFSAHVGKNIFRCFYEKCGAQGNVLDLWAAIHKLPPYEAALDLAEAFGLRLNRVPTAWAVLPANRPLSDSELTDHSKPVGGTWYWTLNTHMCVIY
jgi:hypothetical protein